MMLNTTTTLDRLAQLGKNTLDLANACQVPEASVRLWLAGARMPRPSKCALLAACLELAVDEILPPPMQVVEPRVRYRSSVRWSPVDELKHAELDNDIGRNLEMLVATLPASYPLSSHQLAANLTPTEAIVAVRELLGLTGSQPVTTPLLLRAFLDLGVWIVPVPWGRERAGRENTLSVFLPSFGTAISLVNEQAPSSDILAHLAFELGASLMHHAKTGQALEDFATAFCAELLASVPQGVPVDILSDGPLATTAAGEVLAPSPLAALKQESPSGKQFPSPVYAALARWQHSEGGRSPALMVAALGLSLGNAVALSHYLWDAVPRDPAANGATNTER
jgi:hypothetical protein